MKVEIDKDKLTKLWRIALSLQMRNAGGIAGQGFTGFTCLRCDSEGTNPNTNVPIFCSECSKEIKDEYLKETRKP